MVRCDVEQRLDEGAWFSGPVSFMRAVQKCDNIKPVRNFRTYHVLVYTYVREYAGSIPGHRISSSWLARK